ncbi:MAG: hypothetical protein NTY66_04100, partial [Candidatus Vogelbacteria bacterium]|nr:hypothetical protein [Candidatus Vogelbacteria bacterium]
MNKNGIIMVIIAVVAIVAFGWWVTVKSPSPVDDVPAAVVSTDQTPISSRQAGAPVATTNSTVATTDTTVVLTGSVNPNGAVTNYWYD